MTLTLLEQLENAGVKIDVDSFDPGIAKSLPFKPHDATSNQALIGLQVLDPAQKYVVLEVVQAMPGAPARDVLTVLVRSYSSERSHRGTLTRHSTRSSGRRSYRTCQGVYWRKSRPSSDTTRRRLWITLELTRKHSKPRVSPSESSF